MKRFAAAGALAAVVFAAGAAAQDGRAVTLDVRGGTLSGVMFVPAKTPAPAVIVLHTKGEGKFEPADEKYAAALSAEGFVAVALNYLDVIGNSKLWSPKIDHEIAHVVDELGKRPEVGGKPVGIVGFSLGAHGILVSALDPNVKALVVYYGDYDLRKAKGIHFPPEVKMPIDVAAEVNAPLLMLHGESDNEIPVQLARDMEAALKAAGKTSKLVVYPGAYHRFDRGPNARMRGNTTREGYVYQYDEAATRDAWTQALEWLRKYLGA
ncbi:MAG: dienelactone hydrolase family protein [Betaproteobacteria bacterium]|nr:dienelactone hydrolase family protein [Betaproteobacteria bacterium]